jgi:hypothetical protein
VTGAAVAVGSGPDAQPLLRRASTVSSAGGVGVSPGGAIDALASIAWVFTCSEGGLGTRTWRAAAFE